MPRLYLQRGLSTRVVRAVSQRLEQILAMASDGAADVRTRSRSPARAAETSDLNDPTVNVGVPAQPEGTAPGGNGDMPGDMPGLDTMVAAPPGVDLVAPDPSEPEMWKQQLEKVLSKLQGVSFELSAAVDAYGDHHDKLRTEISALGEKLESQSMALTTVGASMASEVVEINKLLRAFDKFAGLFKWTFGGKNSVETNMSILQQTMMEQKAEFESTMVGALSKMSTLLEKLVENTAKGDGQPGQSPIFPPQAPETPPIRTGMEAPASVGGMPAFPLPTPPPVPPNTGTSSAAAVNPPKATGAGAMGLPTSLFLAFCPETPGGQRPSAPTGEVTPCQRVGILTKDAGSNQQRTLSPTGYRSNEIAHLTSLWAPNGLGTIRDGQQLVRRIY